MDADTAGQALPRKQRKRKRSERQQATVPVDPNDQQLHALLFGHDNSTVPPPQTTTTIEDKDEDDVLLALLIADTPTTIIAVTGEDDDDPMDVTPANNNDTLLSSGNDYNNGDDGDLLESLLFGTHLPPPPTAPSSSEEEEAILAPSNKEEEDDDDDDSDKGSIKEPANKKPRTSNPVRIPVAHTMVPGAEYSHGLMQLPESDRAIAQQAAPIPNQVLPPRIEHTVKTLTPPGLKPLAQFIVDRSMWQDEYDPQTVLRQQVSRWYFQQAAAMIDDPNATSEQLRAAQVIRALDTPQAEAALRDETRPVPLHKPQLLTSPQGKAQRSIRLVDPSLGPLYGMAPKAAPSETILGDDGKPLNAKQKQQKRFFEESQAALLSYYVPHDPEPDPELPFGLPPWAYPASKTGTPLHEQREAYKQRYQRLRQGGENMPRADVELVHRVYLDNYRRPINTFPYGQHRDGCCRGEACIVIHMATVWEGRPQWAYTLPAFYTPSEEQKFLALVANGKPKPVESFKEKHLGPCIECLLYSYTMQVNMGELPRKAPEQPLNRIQVYVGEGEYARDVMLPVVLENGIRTGIEGHVPVWDAQYRQFDPQPGDTAVLREVNVDFHLSLSQTNSVLGVRKSRPLAGASRSLPLEKLELAFPPPPLVTPQTITVVLQWERYVRTCPMALLADRALVAADTMPSTASRVPAIWLRHCLLLEDENRENPPTLTPLAQDHLRHLTPQLALQQLKTLFHTEDLSACLAQLAAGACCSFEDSVRFLLTQPASAPLVHVPLALLFDPKDTCQGADWAMDAFGSENENNRLGRPSYLTPENATRRDGSAKSTWILYTTCVWRIAVVLLLHHVLRPWARNDHDPAHRQREYCYKTHQFMMTHDDFLTLYNTLGFEDHDDRWWLTTTSDAEPRFSHVYPQSTRVCCAEELLDLTPLFLAVNQWCDMTGKKQNTSMLQMLIQLYLKTKGYVCMMRGNDNITVHAMKSYQAIHNHIVLVLRCALLGGFPKAEGRPPLHARIRINASFAPRSALLERVTPAMEEAHAQEIQAWVHSHPMLTLALMREHLLYAAEASVLFDRVFGLSRTWVQFKAVARMASGQFRRQVTAWLVEDPHHVCWDMLEKRSALGTTSTGEVVKWHEKAKEQNTKLFKDTDFGIMLRKMRVEKKTTFQVAELENQWLHKDGRLEALHAYAWAAVQATHYPMDASGRMRPAVPTGVLKVLGMSEVGFTLVREWLHASVEYHTADDNFDKLSQYLHMRDQEHNASVARRAQLLQFLAEKEELSETENEELLEIEAQLPGITVGAESLEQHDYVLFKLYLRLYEYYTNDRLGFTSVNHWRSQLLALRHNLGLPWSVVTPATLGYAHFCEGCGKWAHPVVRPSREYLGMPPHSDRARQHFSLNDPAVYQQPVAVVPAIVKNGEKHKKKHRHKPRPCPPRALGLADGRAACMTGVAFNPLNGQLYCTRGNLDPNKVPSPPTQSEATSTEHTPLERIPDEAAYQDDDDDAAEDLFDDQDDDEEEEEAEDDFGDSAEDEDLSDDDVDNENRRKKRGTKKKKGGGGGGKRSGKTGKDDISRKLFTRHFHCRAPLVAVDLCGVYMRLQHRLYGRCVYCGRVCEVINANITNRGLSCGEHALVGEYPRGHRLWRHIARPAEKDAENDDDALPKRCVQCHAYDSQGTTTLLVHDPRLKLAYVTLCRHHADLAKSELPRPGVGDKQVVPVAWTALKQQWAVLD